MCYLAWKYIARRYQFLLGRPCRSAARGGSRRIYTGRSPRLQVHSPSLFPKSRWAIPVFYFYGLEPRPNVLDSDGRYCRATVSVRLISSCYHRRSHFDTFHSERPPNVPPTYEDQAQEDLLLPVRSLSRDANLDEYRRETATGTIVRPTISADGHLEKYKLVTFTIDDPQNPKNWSKAYKWWCTAMIASVCFVVAFCSSVVTADIEGVSKSFGVSEEVSLLTISLFVVGFGIGT